jgi:ABC-type nitrate/sulfonate/bicarbonate transport system permease component
MAGSTSWLFELRGPLKGNRGLFLSIAGLIVFLGVWTLLSMGSSPIIPPQILPAPLKVLNAFGDLHNDNDLIQNITLSLALNYGGYIKAILWGIPIGYLIGLLPVFKGLFMRQVDAIRFLPITALIGIFIIWFGIGSDMKINFLAFGIFIYLLPTMISRINDVDDVYVKTVHTLGASKLETFSSVFLPSVLSKIIEDIRVLTAISWTYIIVIETTGSEGGLGQLIYSAAQRQGRVDKTFALLIIIMVIGVLQDRLFGYLDRKFFPHKYQVKKSYQKDSSLKEITLWSIITDFIVMAIGYIFLGIYAVLALNEIFGFLGDLKPFEYFFGARQWVVHFIGVSIIVYQTYSLYKKYISKN